jgi:hypothetical protein
MLNWLLCALKCECWALQGQHNELKQQYEMLNSSYQAHMEGMAKQAEAAVMETCRYRAVLSVLTIQIAR